MSLVAFAEMAADCYNRTPCALDFHGWKRSSDKDLGSISSNNFFACAYQLRNTNIVAVGYRGTQPPALNRRGLQDSGRDIIFADMGGIGLSLNSLAMNVQDALDFAYQWSQRAECVWLTGHSLGGAYVQIAAAILGLAGFTFNAPGALHLVNQYSQNALTKYAGSICNPTMQILVESLSHLDLVNYFGKALAADNDLAFAAVANYRAQNDPVSRLGAHVGAPMQVIQVRDSLNPITNHSIALIVEALGGQMAAAAGQAA